MSVSRVKNSSAARTDSYKELGKEGRGERDGGRERERRLVQGRGAGGGQPGGGGEMTRKSHFQEDWRAWLCRQTDGQMTDGGKDESLRPIRERGGRKK